VGEHCLVLSVVWIGHLFGCDRIFVSGASEASENL
jgi:hypothetical protein